jgi:hypothetical protein
MEDQLGALGLSSDNDMYAIGYYTPDDLASLGAARRDLSVLHRHFLRVFGKTFAMPRL